MNIDVDSTIRPSAMIYPVPFGVGLAETAHPLVVEQLRPGMRACLHP